MPIDPITGRSLNRNPIMTPNTALNLDGFPAQGAHKAVVALNAVAVATTSAAVTNGANSIQLEAIISDAVTSWDLQVFRVDPGPTDTLVKTFTGINNLNKEGLFVGPSDHVALNGRQIKVRGQNQAGGTGTLTVNVKVIA